MRPNALRGGVLPGSRAQDRTPALAQKRGGGKRRPDIGSQVGELYTLSSTSRIRAQHRAESPPHISDAAADEPVRRPNNTCGLGSIFAVYRVSGQNWAFLSRPRSFEPIRETFFCAYCDWGVPGDLLYPPQFGLGAGGGSEKRTRPPF